MDRKEQLHAEFRELTTAHNDFLKRFAAFDAEHAEYLKPLLEEAEGADYPRVDPQEIFDADNYIDYLEQTEQGDTVADFDALKYAKTVYHQRAALIAEGRYFSTKLFELQIAVYQNKLQEQKDHLADAQNALLNKNPSPNLPKLIELLNESIDLTHQRIGLLNLQLANQQPHLRN